MSLLSEDVVTVTQAVDLNTGALLAKAVVQPHVYLSTATYDFAVSGGAIGTIYLPLSVPLPLNSIYTGIIVEHVVAVTANAGATIALGLAHGAPPVAVDNTIVAAALFSAAPYTGAPNTVTFDTSSVVKQSAFAATHLAVTIAVNTVTAGQMIFGVNYVL